MMLKILFTFLWWHLLVPLVLKFSISDKNYDVNLIIISLKKFVSPF